MSLISRLLPDDLTARAFAQKEKLEGERRRVTVMFCDLVGYTGISEQIGSEEAFGLMERVYEILIRRVNAYEGTVNELTGDGIMAFFGAPVALEDAPQRAIRSALSIHREMIRLNESLWQKKQGIPPLCMRIGIHTGPVVVGSLGSDLRVEFKAVGDTVNLASRLQGLTEPGTVYVSEQVFGLTEGLFRFESLGSREIRGRQQQVAIYRVIGPSTSRTRFDVSAERGLTPFVGRYRELELLLDGFERARVGNGQVFSIIAEAGAGKSRLLYEFRKAIARDEVTFLEGRCLSYGRTLAYHPVVDLLKSGFDIRDWDTPLHIVEKITRGLEDLGCDQPDDLSSILELFSLSGPGTKSKPTNPEVRKHRTLNALSRIALRGSGIRPLILAVEDLHWIDRSSEEFLKELMAAIPASRVFLIMTYRPEFVLTWGARSYHGQANLNRLSNRDCLAMARDILGVPDLAPDLENLILEKAEGIPLFVEEFTKSLRDLDLIKCGDGHCRLAGHVQEPGIPSTIQDVIMARVDTVPEDAREILKAGSVIGREFGYPMIRRLISSGERELLAGLSALKDSELLFERGVIPDSTFIFKHALTREVVYGSILTRKLKRLHQSVGEAIEEVHSGMLDEYFGVLANHFAEGEQLEKSAKYSGLAAKKANKVGAYLDAVEHARKRIECYEKSGDSPTSERLIAARTILAGYYLILSDLVQANQAVFPIAESVSPQRHPKWLPGVLTTQGLYRLIVEEDKTGGIRLLKDALKASARTKERAWLWFTYFYLGFHLAWDCKFAMATGYIKESQEISIAAKDNQGIATSQCCLTLCQTLSGALDRTYPISSETMSVARNTDNPSAIMWATTSHGICCYYRGLFDEAERTLLSGLEWHEKSAQLFWGIVNFTFLGDLNCDMGKYEEALEFYERGIIGLEACGLVPSWSHMLKISAARAEVLAGRRDIARNHLAELYQGIGYKLWLGWSARNIAEIIMRLADGPDPEAKEWLNLAITEDRRNATPWHLARDLVLLAEFSRKSGDLPGAKGQLAEAAGIFGKCGAEGFRERAERELAELGD